MNDSEIREWSARGLTLSVNSHGMITVEKLGEFARRVRDEFPGQQVYLAEHSLRVTDYDQTDGGPHFDWRD